MSLTDKEKELHSDQSDKSVTGFSENADNSVTPAENTSPEIFKNTDSGANVNFAPEDENILPESETVESVDTELSFYEIIQPAEEKKETKKRRVRYKTVTEKGGATRSLAFAMAYISAVLIIGVLLGIFIVSAINDVFAFSKDTSEIEITISDDKMTVTELADLLHENGLIRYDKLFKLYVNLKNHGVLNIRKGTFTLSPSYNYDKMLSALNPAPERKIVRITFPEGITVDEMIDLFVSNGIGTREGFVDAINNGDFEGYWFLKDLETTEDRYYRLEGYLYPDTYDFYTTSSEITVLKKLLSNFRKKFSEEYMERINELGITVDQAVIIASMIEKEALKNNDYVYVSAVFHNRLKSSSFSRFDSDATVQYVLEHLYGERHEELTQEDLNIDSPYNTRLSDGYPPGPICNPSLNALKAAIYPDSSCGYYYFVTDADGDCIFAKSYSEHQKNVSKVEAQKKR